TRHRPATLPGPPRGATRGAGGPERWATPREHGPWGLAAHATPTAGHALERGRGASAPHRHGRRHGPPSPTRAAHRLKASRRTQHTVKRTPSPKGARCRAIGPSV